MEDAIHDLARTLEPTTTNAVTPEVEIEINVLDDPWFIDDDAVVEVTEDAYMLDRSMRLRAALAIA